MTKVAIRPLKGDPFEVEVEPEEKVEDLKKRIATLKPDFPADLQKLLHAGKILTDGSVVSEYGIKPGGFIVMMVSKASQPKPTTPQATTPVTPALNPTAAPNPTPPPGLGVQANAINESAVRQLCEMGFPREQVEKCLRAAFNNADRAVEYLTSGIPESQARSRSPPPTSHGHHQDTQGHSGHSGHGEGEVGHTCGDDCSGHGHGDVHGDAHGHGHATGEANDPIQAMLAAAQNTEGHGDGNDQNDPMDEGNAVTLTAAEQEAVTRLTALGFSEEQALEAYLVCDRKEEIAANYLFDGP